MSTVLYSVQYRQTTTDTGSGRKLKLEVGPAPGIVSTLTFTYILHPTSYILHTKTVTIDGFRKLLMYATTIAIAWPQHHALFVPVCMFSLVPACMYNVVPACMYSVVHGIKS